MQNYEQKTQELFSKIPQLLDNLTQYVYDTKQIIPGLHIGFFNEEQKFRTEVFYIQAHKVFKIERVIVLSCVSDDCNSSVEGLLTAAQQLLNSLR